MTAWNNTTEADDHGLHSLSDAERYMWYVLYTAIAVLAVTGNALVIYVIISRRSMKNVVNYLIMNLATADMLTGLLAIPFKFQAALLQRWVLPRFMCQLIPFIETVSLSVSVCTLSIIAIDRFRSVVFPASAKLRTSGVLRIIVVVWVICVAFSVPYGLFHTTVDIDGNGTIACYPMHHSEDWWTGYNIGLAIVQYYIPLFVINICYVYLAARVWHTEPSESEGVSARRFYKSKKKVVNMLLIVVTVFTFCWLPYETYLVLAELTNINEFYYINIVFFISHCLAMSNSCLNPIIYGIYNEKFQREYKRVFNRVLRIQDVSPKAREKPSASEELADDETAALNNKNGVPMSPRNRTSSRSPSVSPYGTTTRKETRKADQQTYHMYIQSELGMD